MSANGTGDVVAVTTAVPGNPPPRALVGEWVFRWEHPEGKEAAAGEGIAALLEAHTAQEVPQVLRAVAGSARLRFEGEVERPPGPWFGGVAFDPYRPSWEGFPPARWVLPRVLYWSRAGRTFRTEFQGAPPVAVRPHGGASSPPMDRAGFGRMVDTALAAIGEGAFEKVVLARAIDLACSRGPDTIVAALAARFPTCRTFAFRSGTATFVGATPETLLRLEEDTVHTEALAGSASPRDAERLRTSEKDLREHRAVVDGIREALSPLTDALEIAAAPELVFLANVVHLRTEIRARRRQGIGLVDLVEVLHPTPAVGGRPRHRALSFLAEHEGLVRGWYGGAVGWVGASHAELAVALRCALVEEGRARLFVGAGVVRGSTPEGEWRETELKSLPMLEASGGGA
ncbi:MAG: isochorismate synthase [Myxococcota bacterium]